MYIFMTKVRRVCIYVISDVFVVPIKSICKCVRASGRVCLYVSCSIEILNILKFSSADT